MKNTFMKNTFCNSKVLIILILAAGIFGLTVRAGDVVVNYYYNIDGTSVASLTNASGFPNTQPDSTPPNPIDLGASTSVFSTVFNEQQCFFNFPIYSMANLTFSCNGTFYGAYAQAWIDVPATGYYKFYVSSIDASELWLSTNAAAANAQRIAYEPGAAHGWVDDGIRSSVPIYLQKGQQYYVKVLQKAAFGVPISYILAGNSFFEVGWTRADGVTEQPMPLTYFQPFTSSVSGPPQIVTGVAGQSVTELQPATFQVTVLSPGGSKFQWYSNNVAITGATNSYYIIPHAPYSANGAQFKVVATAPDLTTANSSATLTVSQDSAPPVVKSAGPFGNPNGLKVIYSKLMDMASSTSTGNYSLKDAASNTVTITGATLASDGMTAVLQLGSSLHDGTNYTLTIGNVKDATSLGNTISSNPTNMYFTYGGVGLTYTFDDGVLPAGTTMAVGPDAGGNQNNPAAGVTNAGGLGGSGMLILTEPAVGQTYAQWLLPDLASGLPITNLSLSFNLFIGNGSGGNNTAVANPGGNGMIFHWGPGVLNQYTGSASSWGYGLDVTFRTYNSTVNTPGVNILYGGTAGPGANTPIATNSFSDYYQGAATTFDSNTWVNLSVQVVVQAGQTNAIINLVCSNSVDGLTNIYSGFTITNFNMSLVGQPMAFTSADGAGAHESCFLDNVDFTINGSHIAGSASGLGPVAISLQPSSVTTNENSYASFTVVAGGAGPFTYQWMSNGIPIAGANLSGYTTPLTLYSTMNGAVYTVAVSNWFSGTISSGATLTINQDTTGVSVLSVGSANGSAVSVAFSSLVDPATAGNAANYAVTNAAGANVPITSCLVRFGGVGDSVQGYELYGNAYQNYSAYQKVVKLNLGSSVTNGYKVTVKSAVKSRTGIALGYNTNLVGQVLGLSDADMGITNDDPRFQGEVFSSGSKQATLIASGSNIAGTTTGASTTFTTGDHGHFAYRSRTNNFDMMALLSSETATDPNAKAGIMVCQVPGDVTSPMLEELVKPLSGANAYEVIMRTNEIDPSGYPGLTASWQASGAALGATWPNNWIRVRRILNNFYGYSSSDGINWNLIGLTTQSGFPKNLYVGLAATAHNNDGRVIEADFQNWGITTFSNTVITITTNLNSTYGNNQGLTQTFTVGVNVSNAPASELVYEWQRKGPSDPVFSDIATANDLTNVYTTPPLSIASDNNSQYRVIIYVGDITAGYCVTSTVATLLVGSASAPTVTTISTVSGLNQIVIHFNEPVDQSSATTIGNYTLKLLSGGSAGVTITGVTLGTNLTTVTLSLSGLLSQGVHYTVGVTNVFDIYGDPTGSATSANFTGWIFVTGYLQYQRWLNIGSPVGSCEAVSQLLNYGNYPASPDYSGFVTYSGIPDVGSGGVSTPIYGSVISGFVIPPTNGWYQFYCRANDAGIVVISPDNTALNCTNQVAGCDDAAGLTTSINNTWLYSITNVVATAPYSPSGNIVSNLVYLTGGQQYNIEMFQVNGSGSGFGEFTWMTTNGTVNGSLVVTNIAGGTAGGGGAASGAGIPAAGGPGSSPVGLGGSLQSYSITGTNIGVLINPDLSSITYSGPTNTSAYAGFTATFSVSASGSISAGGAPGSVPVSYQWLSNSVPIAGATSASYTTPTLTLANNNNLYGVAMSVPGLTITNSATLSVSLAPPLVVSAGSFAGKTIGIQYNQVMDTATVTNTANYFISGIGVTSVQQQLGGTAVLLTLNPALSGTTFSVTINNVKGFGGNTIAANTIATGSIQFTNLTDADIGVSINAGYAFMVTNGVLRVQASGLGLDTNTIASDGLNYIYEQRSGDFDVAVHVELIGGANARSKAGLLMRENLLPGSREYAIVVDPAATNALDGSGAGYNGVEVIRRITTSAGVVSFPTTSLNSINSGPNPPVLRTTGGATYDATGATNMYPLWLRMRRAGNNVYVYTGADGINWYLCARDNTVPTNWANAFYLGMMTSANNTNYYTSAQFSKYGNYVAPAKKQVLILSGGDVGGSGNQIGMTAGGSYGSPSALDTPAGNPNAPALQLTPTVFLYNMFINMGYNVTVVHAATSATEDGVDKTLVIWGGDCASADTSSNGKWVALPTPEISWKYSSYEKNYWISTSGNRGNTASKTNIMIVNTNNPIVQGLYQTGALVTVVSTSQYFSYAISNDLANAGNGFTVVAVDPASPTHAMLFYADVGASLYASSSGATPASNTFTNKTPARRVGLWMGDNSSAPVGDWSQSTFDGLRLLTNAINWAVGNMTNAPTVSAPANQTVPVGQVASFSVTASGPGPFTYQWRKISGGTTNNINGAVYADYTTPATVAGDNGAGFQVVATGLYGSVTSSVATLTVQVGSPGFVGSPVFSNGQLTLTWTNGSTLLSSTNLTLPMANWTVVVGASSPYTVPATNSQMFYRIKQ